MTSPASSVGDASMPRRRHVYWGREIPFRNRNFIGREKELADLRSFLLADSTALIGQPAQTPTGQPVQAVYGLGGVGKTELAAEYAHRYRNEYELVWWIRAEREENIAAALIGLGTRLGLDNFQPDKRDYSIGLVMDALAEGDPVEDWLLIFDDAQSAAALNRYIPQSREGGHVIITSRNITWQTLHVDGIELTEFKPEETVEFLRRRVPALGVTDIQADEKRRLQDAKELARELGNLPLAADHASAYLRETGASVEEYLERYRAHPHEVLGKDVNITYPYPVAATWSLSMTAVSQHASTIFYLLAFFAPEPIAEELVIQSAVAGLPESIAEIVGDKSKFRPAVRELSKFSLVKIDGVRNVMQLHRVVQAVTQDRLRLDAPALAAELRKAVHLLLAASDPLAPDRQDNGPIYDRSREHLVSSGAVDSDVPVVRRLIINQVRQLHQRGGYRESVSLGEPALSQWREKFDQDDKLTLALAVEVGMALRSAGRWEDALRLNSETLDLLREYYEDTDEVYLECARSYGRDLSMLGRYDEALDNDLGLLPVYKRERRDDHEHMLKLRNNIAISLRCLGRFEEALGYDAEVLEERRRTLGYDDEYTLTSQFAVARDLRRLGRYQESLDTIREVSAALHKKPWNLFKLLVGAELSLSLRRDGQYDDARRQGEDILERHHALIGREHRQSLLVATYLINDRRFTGDLAAAAELGEETISSWEKEAGPDHPNTNAARANLAVVVRLQGDLVQARQLNERALACFAGRYNDRHPSTLIVMTNLASDLVAVGEVQRAHEIGEKAFATSKVVRGEEHPCTLETAANLALDRRAVGDEAGARELLETTLPALEVAYGKGHPQAQLAARGGRLNMDIEPMAT